MWSARLRRAIWPDSDRRGPRRPTQCRSCRSCHRRSSGNIAIASAPSRFWASPPPAGSWGAACGGGGYEGILNLDPATGPFALWLGAGRQPASGDFEDKGRFVDGLVKAELFLRGATELAAVVVRGLSAGAGLTQRFTGYELAVVPTLKSIELRKATATGATVLAATKRDIEPDAWLHLRLEIDGGQIRAMLNREPTPTVAADDPEPLTQAGHVGLRTWGAALEARDLFVQPAGGERVRIDPAQPPNAAEAAARAQRDFCLLILNLNEFLYVD